MTNHWVDLKNTDCALIMGSNPAENHPMSFKWLTKAREERGAKIICVDPRFTLSASKADIYAPLRQGTDIAFLGGMIKYILDNNKYWHDYVVNYTNAPFLIHEGFDFKDGLFSGYNEQTRAYDTTTWDYQVDKDGNPLKDMTLQHPRCVFQLLKKHYSRYDLDTVSKITGTKKEDLLKVYEAFAATGKPDKSGTILYAMGTTQHTVGSQNVRAFAIIQLLLGNIGLPGGGVQAMRGESNVQGSTDMALLFHLIPGYLNSPSTDWPDLKTYLEKETPKSGYWSNKPKFLISMLKAWWGAAATKENDFAYDYLPKRDAKKNYSHIALFEEMYGKDGKGGSIKGLFIFGSNPIVGGPNANKEKAALANLDWLVAVDLWETETSAFWQTEAGSDPTKIKTEVFLLPACGSYEKEGTVSNSGRWIQYRWKAVEPIGQSKPDLWIIDQIMRRVKKQYANSTDPKDRPILDLTWDYGHGHEPEIDLIVKEMNGYEVATGKPLPNFGALKEDGSTACGIWIWGGIYPEEGKYLAKRRDTVDTTGIGAYLNWAFAWPANRRIVYNRCSADLEGKPWSEAKKLIWWDPTKGDASKGEKGKWVGLDVPDFKATTAPNEPGGNLPYIMKPEGVGCLFANKAQMKEGPFPEHYEPWESPVQNIMSKVQFNPTIKVWEPDKQGKPDKYPIIGTTYRVTSHWQAGAMTRNLPWLAELTPNVYVEMSESLAKAKGISNGDEVIISTTRGEMRAYALVTKRVKPFDLNGKKVEQIGVLWHFGFKGVATGDSANKLTPHIGDANTMIPEYKAWLCDVRRAK